MLLDGLTDEREAVLVAKRMLDALRAPVDLGGHVVTVRASIGVATARGPGGDLLRDADLAMYQAKSQGRDRVVSFDEDMHAAMVASVATRARAAAGAGGGRAVARVPADRGPGDRRVHRRGGARALAGPLPPLEFIPLAEETGLIVPLGAWVLEEACRTAASWPGDLAVTVNVSSVQLRSAEFVATVAGALERGGLPATG